MSQNQALVDASMEALSRQFEVKLSLLKEFIPQASHVIFLPSTNGREAAEMTASVLAENESRYHCFFNERGFHNHIVHHALASYSLGANAETIKANFERQAVYQRPIVGVENEEINSENWTFHLEDENYYQKYLKFFSHEIKEKGAIKTVEEYVFNRKEGNMLSRSFGGLLHPFIHWGYGLEFKIDHIVAEGLAQTAAHSPFAGLKSFEIEHSKQSIEPPSNGAHQLPHSSRLDWESPSVHKTFKPKKGLTGFDILSKIAHDPALEFRNGSIENILEALQKSAKNERLAYWIDHWIIDEKAQWDEIIDRTKEIIWVVTVIYATSYDKEKDKFILDFVLMHLVTASIFLPVTLPVLESQFRPKLLKAFFRAVVIAWTAKGAPELELFKCLSDSALISTTELQCAEKEENPWFKVLGSAAKHPDEHTTKIIRTFAFASTFYGTTKQGYYYGELKGTDLLDSSIFLRAAIMTLNKMDWERKHGDEGTMKWFD
ncbi:hypothetical protein O181_073478 [Austropuccinia psidii MF-1]|uniref:Oxidoreductase AflY n=1 Tax=Austropuccinia psidii MF-1 TaxID=1389203 RepID=A0A9Q3F534_9BASI|nr:hypothetical protein [Austropuccinia psidii MF-1]